MMKIQVLIFGLGGSKIIYCRDTKNISYVTIYQLKLHVCLQMKSTDLNLHTNIRDGRIQPIFHI